MRRRTSNSALRCRLGSALLLLSTVAVADESRLTAQLSCRPEAAPGRVLCELRYAVDAGARLAWVDALVTASPEFARPLRSRVTPERFFPAAAAERKLSLAFVASKPGVGDVTVRARAVVCRGAGEQERCRPQVQDVHGALRVGS